MSGYIRRYLSDPGLTELLKIEGVVIIDREPASSINGVGTGCVCLVAEFENGEFNKPIEVMSGQDVLTQFGGFGFAYDGIGGNNPCARSRTADGAAKAEYWNGNGYIAMYGKKFSRLVLTRVDTSVGQVSFTRLAYLDGGSDYTWNLEPGQVLSVKKDGAGAVAATFDAAVAEYASTQDGSFPATLAGGETITITIDEGTPQQIGPVVVTFVSTDTTQALMIARINAALGYTAVLATSGVRTKIQGRIRGTASKVNITQITTAIGTALGWAVSSTSGTGDVANIDSVTFAEAKARIESDVSGVEVERTASGNIRIISTTTSGTPSIEIASSGTTAVAFGFPRDTEATPTSVGVDGVLPAGVEVSTADGLRSWITMQDVSVSALTDGPYTVKVRPALDDGTATSALPGAVTMVTAIPSDFGAWAVSNTFALTAALTEAQLDAAYATAFDATKNPSTVAKEVSFIVSARQSNALRIKTRSNALEASSSGLQGRKAIIRPPLGVTRAVAKSGTAQPGVGAYRDQRVYYTFPGFQVNIPAIARLGLLGGAGFTATGNIDVGADTWLASVCSQLAPEENPAQTTNFMANVIGLEANNPDIQSMEMDDYTAFKRAGICAGRMESGAAIFQSGVTSVDPQQYSALVTIARRNMADYIQDSIAIALNPFTKKMNTKTRRGLVIAMIDGFLKGLKSEKNEEAQRIDDFVTDYKRGNTPQSLAAGLFRCIIKVRTLSSLDVIVIDTEIGEGVLTVKEAA